jgi:phenylpropionate dioxygenase-like ring-hydroxylating dioxygenase large terminal subunit
VTAGTDALTPTLDGIYYTDPGILTAEFEHIFEQEWYYAGRADEIPAPGRFVRPREGRETVILV